MLTPQSKYMVNTPGMTLHPTSLSADSNISFSGERLQCGDHIELVAGDKEDKPYYRLLKPISGRVTNIVSGRLRSNLPISQSLLLL